MKPNFLTEIVDSDLAAGRHNHVVTRFPPEPNGYLHIGHAKSICLNAGLAQRYSGTFHLRFDDTNPVKEDIEYVDSIQYDVAWLLGGTLENPPWQKLFFASDFFEKMYAHAVELVKKGLAYVDSQTAEVIREQRGDFNTLGSNSPFRDREIAENLDLLGRMRAGEFADGAHVLRARIDMKSANMLLRDPVLYRIKRANHHRTGDDWCIYPMYDFAHCLEDANEGVTHSVCTLEFESNRALYDWVLDNAGDWGTRPRQYEFARLALGYTVMSKRKLLQLVEDKLVDGWDDPRMATVSGLRNRGVTAEAIRAFVDMIGISKNNSMVDIGKLEHCIRTDLEAHTPRAMAVLHPLKVTLTTWENGHTEWIEAPWWTADGENTGKSPFVGASATRKVPLTKTVWIERADFAAEPRKGFKRLVAGGEVRLRHGCVIRCDEVVRDAAGEVTELMCSHDAATIGGTSPKDRKVAGTIHWVSAEHGVAANVRLYDRLFTTERPDGDPEVDFKSHLNPHSLVTVDTAVIEPALRDAPNGTQLQFERVGYFIRRGKAGIRRGIAGIRRGKADGSGEKPEFWRTITLRDTWGKKVGDTIGSGRPDRGPKSTAKTHRKRDYAAERADGDPALNSFFIGLTASGVGEENAFAVSASTETKALYEGAFETAKDAKTTAKWLVNVLPAALADTSKTLAAVDGASFGRLVALVASKSITAAAGKEVLTEMLATGREAAAIVDEKGLLTEQDAGALAAAVDSVFAANPDEAGRYAAGERKLMGFFMGQVMREMRGKGDPAAVRAELGKRVIS